MEHRGRFGASQSAHDRGFGRADVVDDIDKIFALADGRVCGKGRHDGPQ